MTMKEIKQQLFENGFKDSYPFRNPEMVQYTAKNGNHFHVCLNPDKPNQVKTLRGMSPDSICAAGLIGNFIGGKGHMRRFSFKSPEELISKLEAIKF